MDFSQEGILGEIGYLNFASYTHSCETSAGQEGLKLWAVTQIQTHRENDQNSIQGFQKGGENKIEYQTLLNIMDRDQRDQILEACLQNYILTTDDIRKGPQNEGPNAGIIPLNSCKDNLTCESGSYTWREQVNLSWCEKLYMSYLKPDAESMNYLNKIIFTSPCPSCGIAISKNGGCPYILCQKGKNEFGWSGLAQTHGHQHESELFGYNRIVMYWSFIAYGAFVPGVYFVYSHSYLGDIFKAILTRICVYLGATYYAALIVTPYLMFAELRESRKNNAHRNDKTKSEYLTELGMFGYVIFYPILYFYGLYDACTGEDKSEEFGTIITYEYIIAGIAAMVAGLGYSIYLLFFKIKSMLLKIWGKFFKIDIFYCPRKLAFLLIKAKKNGFKKSKTYVTIPIVPECILRPFKTPIKVKRRNRHHRRSRGFK